MTQTFLCDEHRPDVVAIVRAALRILADPESRYEDRRVAGAEAMGAVAALMDHTESEACRAQTEVDALASTIERLRRELAEKERTGPTEADEREFQAAAERVRRWLAEDEERKARAVLDELPEGDA